MLRGFVCLLIAETNFDAYNAIYLGVAVKVALIGFRHIGKFFWALFQFSTPPPPLVKSVNKAVQKLFTRQIASKKCKFLFTCSRLTRFDAVFNLKSHFK